MTQRDSFEWLTASDADDFASYHTGAGDRDDTSRPSRLRKADRKPAGESRRFVWWDGEGGDDDPVQRYLLFGYVTDGEARSIRSKKLGTRECLELLLEAGRKYPNAWHVGFSFEYDVNMILQGLPEWVFVKLRDSERKSANITLAGTRYRIQHYPSKWFRVTKYGKNYGPTRKHDKQTVKVDDVFGFFQTSFASAVTKYLSHDAAVMREWEQMNEGKSRRRTFGWDDIDYIADYWEREGKMGLRLVQTLRDACYDERVNLRIRDWYGPGVLANYLFRQRGMRKHMNETPTAVYDAARYAYAGGRFELFHVGRFQDVYGYDLNSAYPAAFARLPSLTEGFWQYVENPRRIAEFGVYHVQMRGSPFPGKTAGPLFHRNSMSAITYPANTDGWYWSPEVMALADSGERHVTITEGWEYIGWETRPFAWVHDMYEQRRRLKAEGDGAEWAIKLALNSMYGKTAQRVGWDRETGRLPSWHQLDYAGWITSYTRAALYRLMSRMPHEQLIAVETDGVWSTTPPEVLGVTHSKELGGWEVSHLDEIVYLQSGLYAKRDGQNWTVKSRGLDRGSVTAESIVKHMQTLQPMEQWTPYIGTDTRFIKYQWALNSPAPMRLRHCTWKNQVPKEVHIAETGKRQHYFKNGKLCEACANGVGPWEQPHTLRVNSTANHGEVRSRKHRIPWLDIDVTDGDTEVDWHERGEPE